MLVAYTSIQYIIHSKLKTLLTDIPIDFCRCTQNKIVPFRFAHSALADPDSVGILFIMAIDSFKSTTHFPSERFNPWMKILVSSRWI
jgi:hypothetical protein